MACVFYLANGLLCNTICNKSDFYIAEITDDGSGKKYFFKDDSILYDLNSSCLKLYESFNSLIFANQEEFNINTYLLPQYILNGGLVSDISISKQQFQKLIENELFGKFELDKSNYYMNFIEANKYKYVYLADCHNLIGTIQELVISSKNNFCLFYKHLASIDIKEFKYDGEYTTLFITSDETNLVFCILYSIIIQLYSIFDVLTKITIEIEHIRDDFKNCQKLYSNKVLFGDKKKIKNISKEGSIFENNIYISMVENLRNELVHNALWENNPKVFISLNNNRIVERFILMPDFSDDGHIETYKNRKRFFSKGKKLNIELPQIYINIIKLINNTINNINEYCQERLTNNNTM